MQPLVAYSLQYFLPEIILAVGFLLTIVIDLFLKRTQDKRITGYFAVVVLLAAGYVAAYQWIPFTPDKQWEGGKFIFPYSQTLFGPMQSEGGLVAAYGMLIVDNFAVFFKLLIALAGAIVVLMSLTSREVKQSAHREGEYYSLILGSCFGMFLMPASSDLIMMYISLELVSIAGYIMAGFSKNVIRSSEAAMKYILYGAFTSGLMIFGFSYLYGLTGTTNIIAIRQVLEISITDPAMSGNLIALWFAVILSLAGMAYKISAVPFHFWTPDVYEGAPTPVTAFLSVASKAAGFGLMMRFLLFTIPMDQQTSMPVIDWPLLVAMISAVTMTLGNFTALQQTNVKRLLAFSSIAHAGYILMGLVVAGAQVASLGVSRGTGDAGIVAILIYLVAYLLMNLGAFYAVMLVANHIGSEELEDYRGLGKRSPLLSFSLTIFMISLIGLPLTVGFIGKLYLFSAVLTQPKWLWLAVVAILNTLISVYYYVRVMGAMFMKSSTTEMVLGDHSESEMLLTPEGKLSYSWGAKLLMFALLIPTIVLGVYFGPLVDFTQNVIRFFTLPQ